MSDKQKEETVDLLKLVLLDADLEGVQKFVQDGGDLKQGRDRGTTAVIVAAFSSQPIEKVVPVLQELVKYKQELDLEYESTIGQNAPNMRALHFFCGAGKTELARILLDAGAQINAVDGLGQTPLFRATQDRHEDLIDILLERGADATIATKRGATPLILLADPIPEEEAGVQQDYEKDARIAAKLIEAGVDVDAIDDDDASALHWCANTGHPQLATVLLDRGNANVNIQDEDGQTPLLLATVQLILPSTPSALKQRIDNVLTVLVNHGANENLKNKKHQSPFDIAAQYRRPDLMRRMDQLLLRGVDNEG